VRERLHAAQQESARIGEGIAQQDNGEDLPLLLELVAVELASLGEILREHPGRGEIVEPYD
jgi:hypothetical protein